MKKTCTIESCGDSAARFDLSFDQLVIAAGIQPRSETVKGASENALSFYTVDDAMKLKETLRSLKARRDSAKINVSVIGGGYGGVEVAANIAEFLGPQRSIVTIVDRNDRLLSPATTFNRKTAERLEIISYSAACAGLIM